MGENLCPLFINKGFISGIYKELQKLKTKRVSSPINKIGLCVY
jgi:hypothetical protein